MKPWVTMEHMGKKSLSRSKIEEGPCDLGLGGHIFDNMDNNGALYILEKEDDRKNSVFGEHYHTSCISNSLDQRQT